MLEKREFYINGEWVSPAKPNDYHVIDPTTEEPCAVISLGDQADTDAAVAAAKAVADPRADRRAAGELATGVHVQRRWAVILVVCLDAVDEREVVHMLRQVRKTIREPAATLAMLGKFKRTTNGDMREREAALQFTGNFRNMGERFAVEFAQLGLVLE